VCKLDIPDRSRKVRDGGSNAKPFLGNDSTRRSPIKRKEIISSEVRDGFLNNFSQFLILSLLKLHGIPPSGNASISGHSIPTYSNFGRRVFM
jgi:hypothetical protein